MTEEEFNVLSENIVKPVSHEILTVIFAVPNYQIQEQILSNIIGNWLCTLNESRNEGDRQETIEETFEEYTTRLTDVVLVGVKTGMNTGHDKIGVTSLDKRCVDFDEE